MRIQPSGNMRTQVPPAIPPASAPISGEEMELLGALRRREEAAFSRLVSTYDNALLRMARMYVPSHAVAEEVVQETWLGVLNGLDGFEARCSLKTWIFQILLNRARTRGVREHRSVPFSALFNAAGEPGEPSVDPSRFVSRDDPEWPEGWVSQPGKWDLTPEQLLLSAECRKLLEQAIDSLPPSQKEVITLRDVQGWDSEEVCNILGISGTNCRVLLHRARSKVRQALEDYLGRA